MKNLKLIFLALGCMAALSLTSCLKDSDDNDGLTPAQISQCYNAVKGTYNGKMVYPSSDTKYCNTDTIDVSWSIGADTMLVIKPFPAKIVAQGILDVDMKEALMNVDMPGELRCYIGFFKYESEVDFLLAPQKVEYPIFYKGATHKMSVYFWNNSYSWGFKSLTSGGMGGQLVMAYALLDDDENKNYINSSSTSSTIPVIFSTTFERQQQQ